MLRVIRELDEEGPLRYVATFLGAHDIPDEYSGRIDDYVALVVNEMLPQVAGERLAEYCDIFCEPSVFPLGKLARYWRRAKPRSRPAGSRRPVHRRLRDAIGRGARRRHRRSPGVHHRGRPRTLRPAGVMPVLLPASVYALGSTRFPAARAMIDWACPRYSLPTSIPAPRRRHPCR